MSRKSKAAEFAQQGYSISVTGRNITITDAIRDYVIEKVSKIEKFGQRILDVVVTVDVQKLQHRVDIVAKVDNIKINSQACTDNLYASIDKATDKLEAQLLKFKNKMQDYHREGVSSVDMTVNVLRPASQSDLEEINEDIEEENRRRLLDKYTPHRIVRREIHSLKTLTDGEALLKMEFSGDPFMVYRSEEDKKIKIIFSQKDGDFGVICPEA